MYIILYVTCCHRHHLVRDVYSLENLTNLNSSLPTLLADDVLTVTTYPGNMVSGLHSWSRYLLTLLLHQVHINTARIVISNLSAQNGIYHIMDEVRVASLKD